MFSFFYFLEGKSNCLSAVEQLVKSTVKESLIMLFVETSVSVLGRCVPLGIELSREFALDLFIWNSVGVCENLREASLCGIFVKDDVDTVS